MTLPNLTGTSKQVSWATSIRKKFVSDHVAESHTASQYVNDFIEGYIRDCTEAKTWIENHLRSKMTYASKRADAEAYEDDYIKEHGREPKIKSLEDIDKELEELKKNLKKSQ